MSDINPPEPGDSYEWMRGKIARVVRCEGERTVVTINGREHKLYTRELIEVPKRPRMSLKDLVVSKMGVPLNTTRQALSALDAKKGGG